jgi:hypothetical protein
MPVAAGALGLWPDRIILGMPAWLHLACALFAVLVAWNAQ